MANLYHEKRKQADKLVKVFRIWFVMHGERKSIYLGQFNKQHAQKFCNLVSELEDANALGEGLDAKLQMKVEKLDRQLKQKLADVGLVQIGDDQALLDVIENYLEHHPEYVSRTNIEWNALKSNLNEFFGPHTLIASITLSDLKKFHQYLKQRYAPATWDKRLKNLKQLFRSAEEDGLIRTNVAQQLKYKLKKEDKVAQKPYVSAEQVEAVLNVLPNAEWRCWFAFIRWLGCRLSEPSFDRWEDVDWSNGTISRWDCKKKQRLLVPIPEELYPYLLELVNEAEVQVGKLFPNVGEHANQGVFIQRRMRRANLEVWPEFFNSLRASRSREYRRSLGPAAEAAWIGHSQEIAAMHYDDVLESDFERAKAEYFKSAVPVDEPRSSVQKSVQRPLKTLSVQMSVQQNDDLQGTQPKVDLATKIQGQMQKPAANCGSSNGLKVPPRGVEPLLPD